MWIATGSASVISACCISMTQARRGPGAGAACNCVETDSRSQPTPLANARVLTNDERIPLPAFVLGGSRASLKLSGQIVSFLLADNPGVTRCRLLILGGPKPGPQRAAKTTRCGLISRRQWDCGFQRWRLRAFDDEPQRERYFPEEGGLEDGKKLVLIFRREYCHKAQNQPGKAAESEPNTEEARQKT